MTKATFPEVRDDYLAAKKTGLSGPRFSMSEADVIFAHIDAQAAEIERLNLGVALWQALYRRAINEANGLTNYIKERPELRRAERNLTAIEADARAALEQAK